MTDSEPRSRYDAALDAYQSGNLKEAARLLGTLLMEPGFRGRAYYGLGLVFLARGDAVRADDALDTAIRLDGPAANAHFYRGRIAEDRGEIDEAVRQYRAALAADGAHQGARQKLSELVPPEAQARAPERGKRDQKRPAAGKRGSAASRKTRSKFIARLLRDPSQPAQDLLEILDSIRGDYRARSLGSIDAVLSSPDHS